MDVVGIFCDTCIATGYPRFNLRTYCNIWVNHFAKKTKHQTIASSNILPSDRSFA